MESMETRKLKKVKQEIEELITHFELEVIYAYGAQKDNRRDRDSIAFSYEVKGFAGAPTRNFRSVLSNYGVEFTDDKQLFELVKELVNLKRYCEHGAKVIDGEMKRDKAAETLEAMKAEMNRRRDASTFLKQIPDKEWEARLATLDVNSKMWRYDLRGALKEFIYQLEQEVNVAKGARVINKNPELMEIYSDLTEMETTVSEMQVDIDTARQCDKYIMSLGKIYNEIVSIDSQLKNPDITESNKLELEARRKELIDGVYRVTTKAEKPQKGVEKIRTLFSDDGQVLVDDKELMSTLREGLEDLEFETNSRKGKINTKMLERDMYDIKRVDYMKDIDDASKLQDPKARKEQIDKFTKNKELKRYAQMLELKRILEEILQKLEEGERIQARYNELRRELARKDLTKEEREKLELEFKSIAEKRQELFKTIPILQDRAKSLAKELKINDFDKLNLSSKDEINSKALTSVNTALKKQKEIAQQRKVKACERYGADPKKSSDEITSTIRERVEEIKKKKWVRENEVNAPDTSPAPDINTQRTTTEAPGGSTSPTPLDFGNRVPPSNIPSNSFGNGRILTAAPAPTQPGVPPSSTRVVNPVPTVQGHSDDEVHSPDLEDPMVEQQTLNALAEYTMRKGGWLIERMEVDDDEVDLQINTTDSTHKQRIEDGVVYRYARGSKPGELYFWKEPLEMYFDNPQKQLEKVLDGLRKRFETELGGKEEVEEFLSSHPHNEFLEGILSKNPIVRNSAKKKFIKKLAEANKGTEQRAYVGMALALQSEIMPDKIDEALSRYSQPYNKKPTLSQLVSVEHQKGFLGLGKKQTLKLVGKSDNSAPNTVEKNKNVAQVNLNQTSDGITQLFSYSAEERGESVEPSTSSRTTQKNHVPKKGENKNQNKGPRQKKTRRGLPNPQDIDK